MVLMYCGGTGTGEPAVDERLVPVPRMVSSDRDPIDATMHQLFLGATPAEADAGLWSVGGRWLPATYIETRIDGDVATIHLTKSFPQRNNISTTTAGAFALHQIASNVFQLGGVDGLEYVVGDERWCGFESHCVESSPMPYFTRSQYEPPAPETCMRAWDDGTLAVVECEEYEASYLAVTEDPPNDLGGRTFVVDTVVLDGEITDFGQGHRLRFESDEYELETPCSVVGGRFEVHRETLFAWAGRAGGIDDCNEESFGLMTGVGFLLGSAHPRVQVSHDGCLVIQRHGDRIEATEVRSRATGLHGVAAPTATRHSICG